MRKMPLLIAIGLVIITFFRVSTFMVFGMDLGILGYFFAFALTAGVFTSAYFTRFNETKWLAISALGLFGIADMWFNTFEMIRDLSVMQLVAPDAAFLGMNSAQIVYSMHLSAIAYGVLPTVFAGMMGALQSRADKVASLKVKSWIAQIWFAIRATFMKGLNATLADWFGKQYFADISQGNSGKSLPVADQPILDAPKIRWEDLQVADKEAIAQMSPRQIMARYGSISVRTARNWKQWVSEGK